MLAIALILAAAPDAGTPAEALKACVAKTVKSDAVCALRTPDAGLAWVESASVERDTLIQSARDFLNDQAKAWNRGDLEAFVASYADDATFITPGGVTHGRDQVLARYKSRYPDKAAMGTLTFEFIEVRPTVGTISAAMKWGLTFANKKKAPVGRAHPRRAAAARQLVDGRSGRVDVSELHVTTPVRFKAADGLELGGVLFQPASGPPQGLAVIAPAMAVLQRMYRAFAAHLADQGFATLTFDYRGIGDSAPKSLRGYQATASDWGALDLTGAIDFARSSVGPGPSTPASTPLRVNGGLPTFVIGHSIGGQLLGLCPRAPTLSAAVLVAAQTGYWKMWDGIGRAAMWLNWHVMPSVSRSVGFLPMHALRQGENVPLGVALEWAQWGRQPNYLLSSELARQQRGHETLKIPLRAYAISDDSYAPQRSVEGLLELYASAPRELKVVTPRDFGTQRIGHFGIFRREFREKFYDDVASWLRAKVAA